MYNLDKKMQELAFEREQVLHHLALLDANINLLKQAIALAKKPEDISLYNTENFTYRRKFRLFKGKIRKYLPQIMRDGGDFTISEITQIIFKIERNEETPSDRHYDAIRKQLNKFYQDGVITRRQIGVREVKWAWKDDG